MISECRPDHGGELDAAIGNRGDGCGDRNLRAGGVNPAQCTMPFPGMRQSSLPDVALIRDLGRAVSQFRRIPEVPASATIRVNAPSISEYAALLRAYGQRIGEIGSTASFLVNPSDPDGRWQEMTGVHPSVSVTDGSFRDIAPDRRRSPATSFVGAAILKGFGKLWALVGLGHGFAISDELPIARLAAWFGQQPVSGPALTAGAVAIDDPVLVEVPRS